MKLERHKLSYYDLKDLPKKKRPSIDAPISILGSARFNKGPRNTALIWGIILLVFSSLLIGPTLWQWWQKGNVQVELNGELITLGWQQAKATALILGFLLIFPIIGLAALIYAFRLWRTPAILVWLTEDSLHLQKGKDIQTYPWQRFQKDQMEFRAEGIVILPLRKQADTVVIGRLASPSVFFQLLDRYISGNNDLVHYHRYEEQLKTTNPQRHFLRSMGSASLHFFKPLTIGLGILLFGSIPFIFVTIVHLKDDGDFIFRLFEYAAVGVIGVFTLAALWQSIKSFLIEYRSPDPGRLWQILSFRQNVGVIFFATVFFVYYFWLAGQTFSEAIFFENLFYYFYAIPVFFACLFLMAIITNQIRNYLRPILALREFGSSGIAGQWSPALAPGENNLKLHNDNFLHEIGGLFSIKPVYAYYDRRLDPEGFQDDKVEFFLQSTAWLDYVTACAKIAQAVIIVPATSESLLMEMNMLRHQGLLHKTFVLMPPENREGQTIEIQWEGIRSTLSKKGYHLPVYEAGGMVYLPREDYSIYQSWKLHHSMRNVFFIPKLRRWQLSRISVHDRIYSSATQLKNKRTENNP